MSLQIRVLGGFSVHRDGGEIPRAAFSGSLPRKLVRVLLTRRGEMVPNDLLVEALWPRGAPHDPRANLKVLVNRARRALGDPSLITSATGGYALVVTDDGPQTSAPRRPPPRRGRALDPAALMRQ